MAFWLLRALPPTSGSSSRIRKSVKPALTNFQPADSPAMPPPTMTTEVFSVSTGSGNSMPRSRWPRASDAPKISPAGRGGILDGFSRRQAWTPPAAAAAVVSDWRNRRRFIIHSSSFQGRLKRFPRVSVHHPPFVKRGLNRCSLGIPGYLHGVIPHCRLCRPSAVDLMKIQPIQLLD